MLKKNTERDLKIIKLRSRKVPVEKLVKKFNLTKQRIWQIVTNYKNPNFKQTKPEKLKILTKRRLEFLGLPTEENVFKTGGRDRLRELVRMRDKHTCQMCDKKWVKGQRRFDVHHLDEKVAGKIPSRKIPMSYDKNNLNKLITFCHKCHFKWHIDRGHNMSRKKSY